MLKMFNKSILISILNLIFLFQIPKIFAQTIDFIDSSSNTTFENQTLDLHNQFRSHHQDTLLLIPSLNLTQSAQNRCHYYAQYDPSTINQEIISQGMDLENFGENIWIGWTLNPNSTTNFTQAISSWYNEHEHYNYDYPGWSEKSAHFTMMIWSDAKELGCARCTGNSSRLTGNYRNGKTIYLICHYRPGGNVIGKFKSNVKPTTDSKG